MSLPTWIRSDVPLAPYSTLELGGPARYFAEPETEAALGAQLAWARESGVAVFVLGGGSNVVIDDGGFDGLVIRPRLTGLRAEACDGEVRVVVGASEAWDSVVAYATERGWAGIECLAGIPGSSGATPVQNVGAYGQEVAETIREVRMLDRRTGEVRVLAPDQCGFGYRDSAFKRGEIDAVIVQLVLGLRPGGAPSVRYAELERALTRGAVTAPSPAEIRSVVLELRRAKSMLLDPSDPNGRSVGSFFTNPVVDRGVADGVVARALARGQIHSAAEVPIFPAERGRVKLAAGWLIEHAGFARGFRRGPVGLSSRHALALVHHGGGSSAELLALASEIAAGVRAAFGVTLALEPVVIGVRSPTSEQGADVPWRP